MMWRRSRFWARAKWSTHDKKKIPWLLLVRKASVLEDPWTRWNCRLHSLLQATKGDGAQNFAHTVGQNPAPDGQRETALWENHPAKAEGPRDGVATSSTLFPGRLSVQFPYILKPGKLLPWTAFQEPQGHEVRTVDLDRDQIARLLEERTRTTAWTMENNCENTQKVLQWWQKLLILPIKLKFGKSVITCVSL